LAHEHHFDRKMKDCAKIALVALMYATSISAFAASFDCTKAESKTEKLICSNPELSSLDELLSATYKNAYARVANSTALRQSQRDWLASNQLKSCVVAACLKMRISERIELLEKLSAEGDLGLSRKAQCVKVRDGTDGTGPSGGYTCMKFSKSNEKEAARMRLQLTSSYDVVRSKLKANGWTLDPEWLRELGPEEKSSLPICGQGWDAICHIQVAKGGERVLLVFSGTNAGTPLISVEAP
jgi:uncharacterized protein YecT (DUF1311 family)